MSTTTSTKPRKFTETPDALTEFAAVEIKAHELRKGMALVDADGFPVFHFTERLTASARSGEVAWFGRDLDASRNIPVGFHRNKTVRVAA